MELLSDKFIKRIENMFFLDIKKELEKEILHKDLTMKEINKLKKLPFVELTELKHKYVLNIITRSDKIVIVFN
jgi:hypothetical protein